MTGPLRTVMFFVEDQERAARWYRDVVLGRGDVVDDDGFWLVDVDGFEVGFHPADPERNPQGGSVVAYFAAASVAAVRERCLEAGARHHRGPLAIANDRSIAQLTDPFGNVFGLDGPA